MFRSVFGQACDDFVLQSGYVALLGEKVESHQVMLVREVPVKIILFHLDFHTLEIKPGSIRAEDFDLLLVKDDQIFLCFTKTAVEHFLEIIGSFA